MSDEQDSQLLKLTAMMEEERKSLSNFLTNLDAYIRGVNMMATTIERKTPVGSEAEADGRALCVYTSELLYWMTGSIGRMRNLMARSTELTGAECAASEQQASDVMARLMADKGKTS